jgi:hypothetical protein
MMEVLLELGKRLGADIGEVLSEDGSWQRRTSDPAGVLSGSATSSMNPSILDSTEDFSKTTSPGLVDIGIDPGNWSLMPELFFDIDPLFGFQAPDLEFECDSSGAMNTQ